MLHGYFPILCVLTDEYFYLSSVSIAVGSKQTDKWKVSLVILFNCQAKLKPECGRVVAFSAGLENLHGVAGVREGRRCALALWFTLRKKHDEAQRHEAWNIFKMAKEHKRLEKLPVFTPEVATHVEL